MINSLMIWECFVNFIGQSFNNHGLLASKCNSKTVCNPQNDGVSVDTDAGEQLSSSFFRENNESIKKPVIIGHRGAAALAPENTLSSFKAAFEVGAEVVEMDVQRTKDGHLVIMHDDTVDRTTNGHGSIKDLTLEEIKKLDAGAWFSDKFKGEKVPTFEEVVSWAKGKVKLDIEIKKSLQYPGIEKEIIEILKKNDFEKNVLITSFDRTCIQNVNNLSPSIETGVLLHPDPLVKALKIGTVGGSLLGIAGSLAMGCSHIVTAGVAVAGGLLGFFASRFIGKKISLKDALEKDADILIPHWYMLDKNWVLKAQSNGTKVFAYTVDKPKLVHKLLSSYGVDGIITDNPERFKDITEGSRPG